MPPLTQAAADDKLLRLFLYGEEKTRKTWWALRAAELGFNVMVLDADNGMHVAVNLPQHAQEKIAHIKIMDSFDRPTAVEFMTVFLKGEPFIWSEATHNLLYSESDISNEKGTWIIDPRKLNEWDVLIPDSYSMIVQSASNSYAAKNNIDLSDADETEDRQGFYRWTGNLLNWMLSRLKSLKSHIIVIGHTNIAEKYREETQANGKKKRTLVWEKTLPKSSSGPHGLQVGQYFSDILYFTAVDGTMFKINTRKEVHRMGGSRIIPPNTYKWEELDFAKVCEYGKIPLPTPEIGGSQAFRYFPPGENPLPHSHLAGRSKGLLATAKPTVVASTAAATPVDVKTVAAGPKTFSFTKPKGE